MDIRILMKKYVRIICVVLILALMPLPTLGADAFPDVNEGDWYYNAVIRLRDDGIVNGFDDGYYYPNSILTAAQFIKMLFYDTEIQSEDGEKWWKRYYMAGNTAGVVDDSTITEGEMDYPLDRYEAARLISRMGIDNYSGLDIDTEAVYNAIKDLDSIPYMFADSVVKVYSAGIIQGFDDGCFHGDVFLTRAQAAQIILKLRDDSFRTPLYLFRESEEAVNYEWFSDAVLIGNSLAGGLCLYGDIEGFDYFYLNGLSVSGVNSAKLLDKSGEEYSIDTVLSGESYGKLILLFGTNELGYDMEYFYNSYAKLIEKVAEYQPGAKIYINSVPPVNEDKVSKPDVFNNKNVAAANEVILRLASDYKLGVIDAWSLLKDDDNSLPASLTPDGIHLNMLPYVRWAQFMYDSVTQ